MVISIILYSQHFDFIRYLICLLFFYLYFLNDAVLTFEANIALSIYVVTRVAVRSTFLV